MKNRWLKMLTVIATVAMVQSTQLNVSAVEYHEPIMLDDPLSVEEMFFDKVDDARWRIPSWELCSGRRA